MREIGAGDSALEVALKMLGAIPRFPSEEYAVAAIGRALERAGLSDSTLLERVQEAVETQDRWRGVPALLEAPEQPTQAVQWERPADWVQEPVTDEERAEWAELEAKMLTAKNAKRASSRDRMRSVAEIAGSAK